MKEQVNKSNINICTSYVSYSNLSRVIELGYLPIFPMRNIKDAKLLKDYSGTAVHYSKLAPSNELFHNYMDGEITKNEFRTSYFQELDNNVDLSGVIKNFETLKRISNAKGIVLLTFGRSLDSGYRDLLIEYLNQSEKLSKEVYEI